MPTLGGQLSPRPDTGADSRGSSGSPDRPASSARTATPVTPPPEKKSWFSSLRGAAKGSKPAESDELTHEEMQRANAGLRNTKLMTQTGTAGVLKSTAVLDAAGWDRTEEASEENKFVTKKIYEATKANENKKKKRKERWWNKYTDHIQAELRHHKAMVIHGKTEITVNDEETGYQKKVYIYHPRPRLRGFVTHNAFETVMAVLIVANCVIIGWQAELRNPQGGQLLANTIIEHSFTAFFSIELVLRAIVFNWTFWFDTENHLDIFLVAMSVLNTWILKPANIEADFLRKATVLRILRLIRIAKNFKSQFKEMWQLLRGLRDSLETLVWTYVMVNIVLYFFAILATVLFGKMGFFDDDEDASAIVQENFDTVMASMFTLFQIMTLDSWSDIMRPMLAVQGWVVLFFVGFITVACFLLMNLITSVIVHEAFEHGKEDKEEKAKEKEEEKKAAAIELSELFANMDEDGSGAISKVELVRAWKTRKVREKFRKLEIGKKELVILWTALDDGDGELNTQEFLQGMTKLQGEAKAKDILKLYREVRILESSIREITILSDYSKERMINIKAKLRATFRELEATRRTLGRIKETARLASRSQPLTERNPGAGVQNSLAMPEKMTV